MALILVRSPYDTKIYETIEELKKQCNLHIITEPLMLDSDFADLIAEEILDSELKTKSSFASIFIVKENVSIAIGLIKNSKLSAHVIVINDKYKRFNKLERLINTGNSFTSRIENKNEGIIDYTLEVENRLIKNKRINNY